MSRPAATSADSRDTRKGLLLATCAYLIWGALPLYLVPFSGRSAGPFGGLLTPGTHVGPLLILAHRVVWSVVLLSVLMSVRGLWGLLWTTVRSPGKLRVLLLSTLLVSSNWFIFTWTNTHGMVLQSSLGYFLTPLFSALLGLVVLRERLRPMQWAALLIALAGVTYFAIALHAVPTAALLLALTWGLYGLVRKIAPVDAILGLTVETLLLLPIALGYIGYAWHAALPGGSPDGPLMWYLSLGCGIFTTVPLLCFTRAAKLLPLSTLGFMQYTGPTCQFLCATVVFHETFTSSHAIAFAIIWTAVTLFVVDAVRQTRRAQIATVEP